MSILRSWPLVAAGCLVALSGALAPAPAQGQVPCEYIADILSVSLPDQEGQPEEIEFTSNDFATYQLNLGLPAGFARQYAGKRVLDVGAGLAEFVDVLADSFGAEALAIDVAYAEMNLSGLSPECVELFHRRRLAMDAQRLLFPSNYFDLVVSHSLFKWFFLFEPEPGQNPRLRIRRGMDILGQMIRVVNQGGEVRTTDLPDPDGPWFAEHYQELVNDYRAAFRDVMRPYLSGARPKITITFNYHGSRGYTVIEKLERVPQADVRSTVSVIRDPRRHPPPAER